MPAKGGSDKKSRRGGGGAGGEPKGQAFDVVLEDTILFAKAGGQPSDAGTINGHRVSGVRVRDGTRGNAPHNIVHTVVVCRTAQRSTRGEPCKAHKQNKSEQTAGGSARGRRGGARGGRLGAQV